MKLHIYFEYFLIVCLFLTLGGAGSGCARDACGNGGLLAELLGGQVHSPQVLVVYADVTPSQYRTSAIGGWNEVHAQAANFFDNAPPASQLEVYVTSTEPGHPALLRSWTISNSAMGTENQKTSALSVLDNYGKYIVANPPLGLQYTGVAEDLFFCAQRAGQLHTASRQPDYCPRTVFAFSDLEQYVKGGLDWDKFIYDNPQTQQQLISTFSTAHPKSVIGVVPSFDIVRMPACHEPKRAAAHSNSAAPPSHKKGTPLTPREDAALQDFFTRLISSWGAHVEISQPTQLQAATTAPTKRASSAPHP